MLEDPQGIGSRWARPAEMHSVLTALASLAVIALIALPVLGLRLGTSDASTDPASWTTTSPTPPSPTASAPGSTARSNSPARYGAQATWPRSTCQWWHTPPGLPGLRPPRSLRTTRR